MQRIIDTNVLVAANRRAPQATSGCEAACIAALVGLQTGGCVVIDDAWHILKEYIANARSSGQPGVGDAFLKWILTNQKNPLKCEQIHITPARDQSRGYIEFPVDINLAGFDPSDRKFVAVCLGHPGHPPIWEALDSKWHDFEIALLAHGVVLEFLS